ncbi:MAG TPA: DUF4112 domain-containing protein [Kofleriaceae bacterium]|jgi:hypothetical protein|nr:DUF4112 domain-containing protein [Kofleriaceae bacterium]
MAHSERFAARYGDPGMAPGDVPLAAEPVPVEIQRARTLTRVLDHYLVDPLLGLLLPGAGDLIGSLLGLYLVVIAVRRRMSPVIVARMLLNLALDAVLGAIPVLGDIADFAYKANEHNLALLVDRRTTGAATVRDWLAVGGAVVAFAAVIGLVIYAIVALIHALA